MAELRRRRSVSSAFLLDLLTSQLASWRSRHGVTTAAGCEVIDLGGGTGGVATTLAALGYRVRVIDPSLDALASLERRTAEAGLGGQISGDQGDATDLVALVGEHGADVVICHRVLEVVDAPADALAAMAAALRTGGALSLLVSQRRAVVLSQALTGHLALARRTYDDPDRFDHERVVGLVEAAGFRILGSHGIGAIADHVPEAVVEAEAGAYSDLMALETAVSQDSAFRALAPAVHVFAEVP